MVKREVDPDQRILEEGTIALKLDTDRGSGVVRKVGLTKDLLDPGLNSRKVYCSVIMLMQWMMLIDILMVTLRYQDNLSRALGVGENPWTLGFTESLCSC